MQNPTSLSALLVRKRKTSLLSLLHRSSASARDAALAVALPFANVRLCVSLLQWNIDDAMISCLSIPVFQSYRAPSVSPLDSIGDGGHASGEPLSPLDIHRPVKLAKSSKERRLMDTQADLFSVIKTVEQLERAYMRDSISSNEYEAQCTKLIAQFKTIRDALNWTNAQMQEFAGVHNMYCPAALHRLLGTGVPATVEHGGTTDGDLNEAKVIAEAVQHFITAMDSLKLNMIAVDEVYPLLNDVAESLNRALKLPPTYDGKDKVRKWLGTLNAMKATDNLSDDQVRQLLFDLESAYSSFHRCLEG